MPFTDDNNLEIPTSGVADWDSPLSSNFSLLARGFSFKAVAGLAVNTGDAVCVMSDGFVRPYSASSLDAPRPRGISETALNSGDESQFFYAGVVRSMTVWSGNISVGQNVFVSPASVGMLVGSYSAAHWPMGVALADTAVMFRADSFLPENVTTTVSLGPLVVGSAHAFVVEAGHRGMVTWLNAISGTASMDYKLQFHTGSARVGSEELYETVTTSVDGSAADFDIASSDYLDRSVWALKNTDITSPGLVFGLLTVQSLSATGSGNFSIQFQVERTF